MKTVILAVLLLLVGASIVSADTTESGKLRYGDETCLAVIYVMTTYGGMLVKLQAF
jgi:hypothetical protein